MSNLDNLSNLPSNMKYVCLSFLTSKQYSVTGVRFGGAFETYDEACKHAKQIQLLDPYHNVFVGEGGKWLPFDPDPNSEAVKDSEYANDKLNEIMKGHKDSQEKAKVFHEMRTNEKIIDNINENINRQNENKTELSKKLSNAKTEDEIKTLTNGIDNIDEQMKKLELKLKECKETEDNLKKLSENPLPLYNNQ